MLNSELVYDDIQHITFDDRTGNIYISTAGGVTEIPSMFGKPVTKVDQVVAFPNPFIITGDDARLDFNYAYSATVTIFNVAGEQIIEMPLGPWDGRNAKGKAVASGVYLFLIRAEDGETAFGKFVLVRQ